MKKLRSFIKNKLKRNKIVKNFYENIIFKPIINLYKESNSKNCLLSYSVFPFKQKEKKLLHPNFVENYTLAEEIRKHGYNIDVYNNTYKKKIDYNKYDLIIGEGVPISKYFLESYQKNAKTIYYATGSHPMINNYNAKKALLGFAKMHNKYIENSARIVSELWSIAASLSDNYMILGNEVTKKTFDAFSDTKNKYILNPPFYAENIISDFSKKDSKHFLWFGSYSLIHKDLNTFLDVFINHPDITLHICGRIEEEKDFFEVYKDILNKSNNIILHGYIGVNSKEFRELMEKCSFTILSSCAEGCSTAIATVMGNGGLIPIISKECGLSIKNGCYVESGNYNSIELSVLESSKYTKENIIKQSKENIEFVNKNFSIEKYKENVGKILDIFLE